MHKKTSLLTKKFKQLCLCCLLPSLAYCNDVVPVVNIRLNQVGFYPGQRKVAIVSDFSTDSFSVCRDDASRALIFKARLIQSKKDALSGKKTLIANFTTLTSPGSYRVYVKGLGYSHSFRIEENIYADLAKATAKAFYYQRASIVLVPKYAGNWARPKGHDDTKVFIHPSAASSGRATNSIIKADGGWYDAGDYNKYIVNSGVTMGTLMSLYEDFPDFIKSVSLDIPESQNAVPDLLDELAWNLRWMLKMQDPCDGGVYNKLTNVNFDGMVMPHLALTPRYVVQKGTAATLDFAAVTAQAARVFREFRVHYPGLADSCLTASKFAWKWAQKHPALIFDQEAMNQLYSPKITTGGYGDKKFEDEFIWAASELFLSTGEEPYLKSVKLVPDNKMPLPSWGNVRLLGYYSLLRLGNSFKELEPVLGDIRARLLQTADEMIAGVDETAYLTVMGKSEKDFGWGSNSVAANQAILLIQAYRLSSEVRYLEHAISNLDYLLGRNGTGYCFLTGFGSMSPMHPHHRPSVADGIKNPVPGFLVGGPNPGRQDKVKLPTLFPDEAYIDHPDSYATNEVAINWQAPMVYLAFAAEALQYKAKYSSK